MPNPEAPFGAGERPADPLGDRLVVALDYPNPASALQQVDLLRGLCTFYKIGLELFIASGPALVSAIRDRGGRVFLDLKLHDIPETVSRAAAVAGGLGVELLTVHAGGGLEMMRRAAGFAHEAADRAGTHLQVLAVTVLTSLEMRDLQQVGVQADSLEDLVLSRARLAAQAGIDGVVASPREVRALRQGCPGLSIVTPGIRGAAAALPSGDDQRRTATAYQAIADGADRIVVGRPLRDAPDPRGAAELLLNEIQQGLRDRPGSWA